MQTLTSDGDRAVHRGVFELAFETEPAVEASVIENLAAEAPFEVRFERPDGSTVTADGFYAGDGRFEARAYCDAIGTWHWESTADEPALTDSGSFEVAPSPLPGKLRRHPEDGRQLRYDDGSRFLHVGDTGYRYPADTESEWRAYVDSAVRRGVTKIRTWFARSRHGVEALFAEDSPDSAALDPAYWAEIDRRFRYALAEYPDLQFQVIPYAEDGDLLRAYEEEAAARLVGRHAQARFSAFPTVYWCLANDVKVLEGEPEPVEGRSKTLDGVDRSTIEAMGRDFDDREPWGTLLTSHQQRTTGYDFVDAPWSDVITLHDIDQAGGRRIREYRSLGADPVVLDEDRYERYKAPENPRYFFRRLFWASLLSGGHPTYGGNRTFEPHDGDEQGVAAYDPDLVGPTDFNRIHAFFEITGLSLAGLAPDPGIVDDGPDRVVCCHDGTVYLAYFANSDGASPQAAAPSETPQSAEFDLPPCEFGVRWYDPTTGEWTEPERVAGDRRRFTTPGAGDWVLLLERTGTSAGA